MQLIISPGTNPLPAVVCLKYSVTGNEVEDEEFYGLDIVEKKHVYKDPVQLGVCIVLCRSLINMFMTFCYDEDPNTKDFTAHYPFHHEQMLVPIIDIVIKVLITTFVWTNWHKKVIQMHTEI